MIQTKEGMITLEGNQHDLIADYGVITLALIVDGEIPVENLQYVLDQASNIAEVYKTEGREAAEGWVAERMKDNEQE